MTELDHTTGWFLIAAAQDGDSAAFGQLWRIYRPTVFGYIQRRVADPATAEDLTSDTFLRAWRSIDSVEDTGRAVGAWLVTIARNLILDRAKSAAFNRTTPWPESEAGDRLDLPDDGPGPEEDVAARRSQRGVSHRLSLYVAQLPADQRECLRLRFEEGLSTTQTGDAMGIAVGAAKALQHRATEKLIDLLTFDGYLSAADFVEKVGDR